MGILQLLMSWLIPVNVAIKLSRPEPKGGTVSDSTDDSNANREGDRPNVDSDKPVVTLTGVVQKIINPLGAKEPEKVEIAIQEADDLYKEIIPMIPARACCHETAPREADDTCLTPRRPHRQLPIVLRANCIGLPKCKIRLPRWLPWVSKTGI